MSECADMAKYITAAIRTANALGRDLTDEQLHHAIAEEFRSELFTATGPVVVDGLPSVHLAYVRYAAGAYLRSRDEDVSGHPLQAELLQLLAEP